VALQQQDCREAARTDRERGPVGPSIKHCGHDGRCAFKRPVDLDRKTEQLGQLADQDRQRDAVHVSVADRFGEKLGDEAQARYAGHDAHRSRYDRHHARKGDGAKRVAAGQRQYDREDDGSQRGVGPQHHDPTGSEQRVSKQRNDRSVEAMDAGHARCHRVGDADGHQHRGQHQSGHDVVP
jgi:hypothetical protein